MLVPKSTLSNWMNEFGRWCPTLRAVRFHGDKHERAEIIQERIRPGIPQSERDWDVLVQKGSGNSTVFSDTNQGFRTRTLIFNLYALS